MNSELLFFIEEAPEGGYVARAANASIYTQGDTLDAIKENIRDAVHCHFDELDQKPSVIRLHIIHQEMLAV